MENTLRLIGVRHMVKEHSYNEGRNLLPLHFLVSSSKEYLFVQSHRQDGT